MNVVFSVDHSALPGLHVAAYSVLDRINLEAGNTRFVIFSNGLDEHDIALLHQTLAPLSKLFSLELRQVDTKPFSGFPLLNDSLATYYRLFAAQVVDAERFLYLDADTLCDIDISELQSLNMGAAPVGWVAEAPLSQAVDRRVAAQLGNSNSVSYFSAGVMLVNVAEWRRQQISERAIDYIRMNQPTFWDQSALNYVLYRNAIELDAKFNCMSNMRKNWPVLRQPYRKIGRLVHFLDYPKPWDFAAEWVHPQYRLWRSVLDQTVFAHFRSWRSSVAPYWPRTMTAWSSYKKALKDRLLFTAYSHGWTTRIKGVPITNST